MRSDIQAVSWWVRRLPDCDPGGMFFRDHLGLPLLGQRGNNWDDIGSLFVFHGGGFFEFELMPGARDRTPVDRIEQQDEIPVFRSYDLDAALASLTGSGATVLSRDDADPAGPTVWFRDPSGALNGLRSPSGQHAVDRVARERHAAGGTVLSGLKPMPAGVFDLGWVRMHVADVAAMTAFYRDVVGLDVLEDHGADGATLWLGDIGRLELRPGGSAQPRPSDRADVPEMWMLRVRDMDAIVGDLKAAGVHFVNDPWWLTGGQLAYFVDPENHLVGIQDHPEDGRPQEQEAWRAWQAGPIRL